MTEVKSSKVTLISDVHEDVVRLVHLGDGKRQLAAAPVFEAVNGTAAVFDGRAVALDHMGDLLALVRVDQKHDLVVSHLYPLSDYSHPDPRCGKRLRPSGPPAPMGRDGLTVPGTAGIDPGDKPRKSKKIDKNRCLFLS